MPPTGRVRELARDKGVTASQLALAEAEVAWVEARQALATAVGQLEAVLGQTIDELNGRLAAGPSPE